MSSERVPTRVDFTGVRVHPKTYAGTGHKRRVTFYRHYVPVSVARRLARRFNISRGARRYSDKLMDYLTGDWNEDIELLMERKGVSREEAVRLKWRANHKWYEEQRDMLMTASEVFHEWLDDILSP